MQKRLPSRFGLRAAILSGLLLWLAHPMPGLWPLAWIALAPLIVSVQQSKNIRQATMRGYWFGWAYFAPTCYWTGLTIVGWTKSPIGWAALFLLTLLAAWFYAFWAGAAFWISRRADGAWRMTAVAAAWVIMEWARTLTWFSFPWAQVGFSQYKFLPIIQISEVTGALGVSFLVILVNAGLAEYWQKRSVPKSLRYVTGSLALIGLLCLAGIARMLQLQDGPGIQIGIMQGDFDYKSGRDITLEKIRTFESMTRSAYEISDPKPSLYVWAESAAPGDALNDPTSRSMLQGLADTYNAAVLTGTYIEAPGSHEETNSALLFTPGAREPARFDKQGLVPFGEFIPFRRLIPESIQTQFQFFATDAVPGKNLQPLIYNAPSIGKVSLGPFICYESVYPHYSRMMTQRGATLLITPSHDQWFQSQAAMEQHLAIVVFRAVENRRDIARPTTDGVSAAIDGRGRILARAPLSTPSILVRTLHLRSLITLYTRFGDWFIALCLLLVLISVTFARPLPQPHEAIPQDAPA